MNLEPKPTVCLVTLVRNESQNIQRCINSTLPFIDSWLVVDLGCTDDTIEKVESTLGHMPGKVEARLFNGFANARNFAIEQAQDMADLILILDADESLCCLRSHIDLPSESVAGLIDIGHSGFTLRQPRLLRSKSKPEYEYQVAERVSNIAPDKCTLLENITITHHIDGYRHLQSNTAENDAHLLKAQLELEPNQAYLKLALAKCFLKQANHEAALEVFQSILSDLSGDDGSNKKNNDEEFWQASYFAANLFIKLKNVAQATELFKQCFELAPERMEPLLRLAELYSESQQYEQAAQLCNVILETRTPKKAGYIEAGVYSYETPILAANIALSQNDTALTHKLLESITNHAYLPNEAKQRLNDVKQRLSLNESNNSQTNRPVHKAAPTEQPILTVGMATFDDFDGVYFSIMSVVLYHPEILDRIEIVVVDNNPNSKHGEAVRNFCANVKQSRYISASEYKGTAVRERIFAEARGDYVLCIDCHVFMHSGSLARLIDYFEGQPDCMDLLHGPMVGENGGCTTHMEPRWNAGFYGVFEADPRGNQIDKPAFDIPLQGLGQFACRKAAWPGFNRKFRGFGGEEGYLHEKFRQRGGRALCLPFLRWTHRFARPAGVNYENRWEDRIRNYLIGWQELGMDADATIDHFASILGRDAVAPMYNAFWNEVKSPFWQFDSVYCLGLANENEDQIDAALNACSIKYLTQKITAHEGELAKESLCRVSLKHIFNLAKKQSLQDIVLVNSNIQPHYFTHAHVTQLKESTWDIATVNAPKNQHDDAASKIINLAENETTDFAITVFKASSYDACLELLSNDENINIEALSQLTVVQCD